MSLVNPDPIVPGRVNAPVTPVGKPETLKVTVPPNPPTEVTCSKAEGEEPARPDGAGPLKLVLKSGAIEVNWEAGNPWIIKDGLVARLELHRMLSWPTV